MGFNSGFKGLIKSNFGEYYKQLVWYLIFVLVRAIVTNTLHEDLHACAFFEGKWLNTK